MQAQVDIGLDQLIKLVKQLPFKQWVKLKEEVEKKNKKVDEALDLESFLLTAPTFSKDQFKEIAKTRKAISRWRAK